LQLILMGHQQQSELHPVWIKAGIVFCLVAALLLAMRQLINWDEFYYLSQIYEYRSDSLTKPVNTFHVHIFSWLASLPVTEVEQIQIARFMMWVCLVITAYSIFKICRAFFDLVPSLLAALCFVSASYTLFYGTHFRTDPIATMLTTSALALLIHSNFKASRLLAVAICLGLSVLITVKIIFIAPAFIAAGFWLLSRNRETTLSVFLRLLATAVVALLIAISLFAWHQSTLATAGMSEAQSMLSSAYSKTIVNGGVFEQYVYAIRFAFLSPLNTILIVLAIAMLIAGLVQKGQRRNILIYAGFAAPLLTLIFYRNSFPYFYPFILPPVMVAVAYAFPKRFQSRKILIPLVIGLLAFFTNTLVDRWPHNSQTQSATLNAVHEIFPEPVSYIDHSSAIGSFHKKGFFMTSWGVEKYVARGNPIFKDILTSDTVPLLLLNRKVLIDTFMPIQNQKWRLLDEDQEILRQNFIPHWGVIMVAGKDFQSLSQSSFEILIPGTYTIEARDAVQINGEDYLPGQFLILNRGQHEIQSQQSQTVKLRWGKNLTVPDYPPPTELFYSTF